MITTLRLFATRHASGVAAVVLALSVLGTGAAFVAARTVSPTPYLDAGDLVFVACQILPYGVVGSVLVARRPDLPFGWLLSLAALALVAMLAIGGPSLVALEHGQGGELAVWGLTAGSLMFLPTALEGLINVRFPSGRPAGRLGRLLDRAIVAGIAVILAGGIIGDSTIRAVYPSGPPSEAGRFLDGTPLVTVANALALAVPVVILLGGIAGISLVARFWRSSGIERLQLKWRAVAVIGSLALFPLAVTETLPDAVSDAWPLFSVGTLVVPVLRYDLWAIDSIIRRSAVDTFESPVSVVQAMVRTAGEMLHLRYVAVRRGDRVVASYGEPTDLVERWPLVRDGEQLGVLEAAPRHGYGSIAPADRNVLTTLGQLVGGAVRAEALTVDLLSTRERLITAREEERRRLRRDLHDGLGPLLTGLGLNLDAAAAQLGRSESKAATYLGNARAASAEVIANIRTLVDELRPPALDELGLTGALKLHLDGLATDARLALELRVPDDLSLPAAVEVAAFRTVVEAVTNAARHSGGRRVVVEIVEDRADLEVTIADDGTSGQAWVAGVGLTGMRERAEELGGTLVAQPTPDGGRIRASYPLGGRP